MLKKVYDGQMSLEHWLFQLVLLLKDIWILLEPIDMSLLLSIAKKKYWAVCMEKMDHVRLSDLCLSFQTLYTHQKTKKTYTFIQFIYIHSFTQHADIHENWNRWALYLLFLFLYGSISFNSYSFSFLFLILLFFFCILNDNHKTQVKKQRPHTACRNQSDTNSRVDNQMIEKRQKKACL